MDRTRKRARVHGVSDGATACEWALHGDQRLLGVCGEPGAASPLSLVASGERHVQIRAADEASKSAVGKLVALESGRWQLQHPQDGVARFYVAMPRDAAASSGVRLLDALSMAISEVAFPSQDEQPTGLIEAAFVESDTGGAVVLVERCDVVEGSSGVGQGHWGLWCWRRRVEHHNGTQDTQPTKGLWTTKTLTTVAARTLGTYAWDARFYTSPVFGRCLHLVGAVLDPETVILTSEVFAVDDDWVLLHTHQQTVQTPSSRPEAIDAVRIWLSPSLRWVVLLSEGGRRVACIRLNPFDATRVSTCCTKTFGVAAADVAFHGEMIAVLFVNGSVQLLELPHAHDQALHILDVDQSGTSDNALCFPRYFEELKPVHVVWDRLIWLPKQHWLLGSCGSKAVRISVSLENSGALHSDSTHVRLTCPTAGTETEQTPGHSLYRRRRYSREKRDPKGEEESILQAIETPVSSKSNVAEVFHLTRVILCRLDTSATTDAMFTLLGITLQRLLRRLGLIREKASFDCTRCEDVPIQVGIMEMLLAQVVLTNYSTIHLTASKVVQAPALRSQQDRRMYYQEDLHRIRPRSSNPLRPYDALRRLFVRCVTEALSNVISELPPPDMNTVGMRAQDSLQSSSTTVTINETAKLLKEIQGHVTTTGMCPSWLTLRALTSVFSIASDLCRSNRLVLDTRALLHLVTDSSRRLRISMLREEYVNRFIATAPTNLLATISPEDLQHRLGLMRDLVARSGVIKRLLDDGAAEGLKLLELLQHTNRSKAKDAASQEHFQAISLKIADDTLAQIESKIYSSPLLMTSRRIETSDAATTRPWIAAVEEDVASFDSFIKLVFVSTDSTPISDDLVAGYIKSSSRTNSFNFDEIELQKSVFRLAGLVMVQVKELATSLYCMAASESLPMLFRELFLFDKLWSSSTTDLPNQEILRCVNEVTVEQGSQDRKISMHGRVTGLQSGSRFELPKANASPDNDTLRRIIRTLAVLLWSFWVRERVSCCKEAIDWYRHCDDKAAKAHAKARRKLGSMAASCALHMKSLTLYRDAGEDDEITSTQLYLLEAAIELNPEAASNVVAWAFSAETVSARHIRRFRAIQTMVGGDKGDDTTRYRNELRRAVLRTIQGTDPTATPHTTLDTFGTCCSDGGFQRIVWALQQRRFAVVTTARPTQDVIPIKKILQSRPSTVDKLISRHEVANLLQAQRNEIEEQIQRLRAATESRSTGAQRSFESNATQTRQMHDSDTERTVEVLPSQLKTLARDDSHPFEVRDLNPRHRSYDKLTPTTDQNTPPLNDSTVLRKGSSSHNMLKLFQLRKDTQQLQRHRSAPRMVGIPTKSLDEFQKPESSDQTAKASEGRPVRLRRDENHILPLRRDHPEAAEIMLLATSNKKSKKTVPISRRSFRLAIPSVDVCSATEHPPDYTSSAIQCTEITSTSIQTDEIEHVVPLPAATVQQVEPASLPPTEPHVEIHSVSVGVQFQEQSRPRTHDAGDIQVSSSVANRYPVYVDLESSNTGKYLHVAQLKRDSRLPNIEEDHIRFANAQSWDNLDTSSADPAPPTRTTAEEEPRPPEPKDELLSQVEILERRRQTYRTHFPPSMARLSRNTGDRNHSVGVDSFTSLKTEMERMKAKLMELENCARDIDDDFKVSQHNLENLGKGFIGGTGPASDAVINAIDAASAADDAPHSTLATKAARDLGSARHLLEQIERLTTTEQSPR